MSPLWTSCLLAAWYTRRVWVVTQVDEGSEHAYRISPVCVKTQVCIFTLVQHFFRVQWQQKCSTFTIIILVFIRIRLLDVDKKNVKECCPSHVHSVSNTLLIYFTCVFAIVINENLPLAIFFMSSRLEVTLFLATQYLAVAIFFTIVFRFGW